jgi:hypothetical protein
MLDRKSNSIQDARNEGQYTFHKVEEKKTPWK